MFVIHLLLNSFDFDGFKWPWFDCGLGRARSYQPYNYWCGMNTMTQKALVASMAAYLLSTGVAMAGDIEIIEHNPKEVMLLDKAGLYINGWHVNGLIKVKKFDDDTVYGADYKLAIADIRADCIKKKLMVESISYYDDENAMKAISDKGRSEIHADFDSNRQQLLIQKLCAELR